MASDGKIRIETQIDNAKAEASIDELQKHLDNLANANGASGVDDKDITRAKELVNEYNRLKSALSNNQSEVSALSRELEGLNRLASQYKLEGNTEAYNRTQDQIAQASKELEKAEIKGRKLALSIEKTGNGASDLSNKIVSVRTGMEQTNEATKRTANSTKSIGKELDGGIKKIGRYMLALFSVRSIYSLLSKASNAWLNSGDANAAQLKANIDYIWRALGSSIAPVLNTIFNTLFGVLNVVQQVVKALTGFELFSKGASSNLSDAAKSSKTINKNLAPFDDMIIASSKGSQTGSTDVAPNLEFDDTMSEPLKGVVGLLQEMVSIFTGPLQTIQFDNLTNGFSIVYTALLPIGKQIWDGLVWGYTNILVPLSKWTIEDFLPTFLEWVASALGLLSTGITTSQPTLQWLWDNILVPFSKFVGKSMIDFLKDLTIKFTDFSNWAKNNQPTMDYLYSSLVGFLIALSIWWTVKKIQDFFKILSTSIDLFKVALVNMNVPLLIALGAFAALAIGVLAVVKNWDKMSNMEKVISVLGLVMIAAAGAAAAVGALQSAWSLGIAAIAIAAGIGAIAYAINSSTKDATKNAQSTSNNLKLARGGIINRPTRVLAGEQGREAYLPLQNNTGWAKEIADLIDSNRNTTDEDQTVINNFILEGEKLETFTRKKKKRDEFAFI